MCLSSNHTDDGCGLYHESNSALICENNIQYI